MQWENKNLQTLQAVKSRVSVLHEKAAEKKENKNQSKQTVTSDCNCQEKSIPKFLSKHSGTCVPSSSFSEGTTVCWQFQGGTARKSSLHYHHLNINVALYLQQLINRDPVTCKMCTIHQTSNDEQTYNRKMSLSSLFWSHCTSGSLHLPLTHKSCLEMVRTSVKTNMAASRVGYTLFLIADKINVQYI